MSSIYGQYKTETNFVTSWLASTGKACGFHPQSAGAKTPDKQVGPEGRNGEAGDKNASGNRDEKSRYTVAIKDFVPLAKYIAGQTDPVVVVPEAVSTAIDRVITLRKSYSQMRIDLGAEHDANEEAKHGYFIGIFETVRDILRPLFKTPDTNPPKPESQGDQIEVEPSTSGMEAQVSDEEAVAAYAMLMEDLNKIRNRIILAWFPQSEKPVDLAAVAVTTNAAMSQALGLIEKVEGLMDSHDAGPFGIAFGFFATVLSAGGVSEEQIDFASQVDFDHNSFYDVADSTFLNSYHLLRAYAKRIHPRRCIISREGIFGRYDLKNDDSDKTDRQKYKEDRAVLFEFLCEAAITVKIVRNYPIQDQFLCLIKEFHKTNKVSFALVFAAQVFLDIHHVTKGESHRSLQRVKRELHAMDEALGNHLEFHSDLTRARQSCSGSDLRTAQCLQAVIRWMDEDPIYLAKVKIFRKQEGRIPRDMPRNRMTTLSPVLTGLYLHQVRDMTSQLGLSTIDM